MDEVIELSLEDEQLRQLLKIDGMRAVGLLKQNHAIWYNMPKPIQSRANRALIALADEAASVKELVLSLQTLPGHLWAEVQKQLRGCLL